MHIRMYLDNYFTLFGGFRIGIRMSENTKMA